MEEMFNKDLEEIKKSQLKMMALFYVMLSDISHS